MESTELHIAMEYGVVKKQYFGSHLAIVRVLKVTI